MFNKIFQKQFLGELFLASLVVAILHFYALAFYLYWIIEWFDMVVHFFGGIAIGFLGVFIFFTSGYFKTFSALKHNKIVVFTIVVMFTLIVALAWEMIELFFGISNVKTDRLDTAVDLLAGVVGSTVTFYHVKNKIK